MEQQPPSYPPPSAGAPSGYPPPGYPPSGYPPGAPAPGPSFGERYFTVGNALGKGFSILFRRIHVFVVLTVVTLSPLVLYGIFRQPNYTSLDDVWFEVVMTTAFSVLLYACLSASVTHAVVEEMNGRRASIGSSLGVGLKRMGPLFLLALLMALIFVGACIPAGFVTYLLMQASEPIGVIAFYAFLFWFLCAFYVVIPTLTVERIGVFSAISRAWFLTKGSRWRLFGMLLVHLAIAIAMAVIVAVVVSQNQPAHNTALSTAGMYSILVAYLLMFLGHAVFTAVTYALLRHDKDGVDVSQLANVFA